MTDKKTGRSDREKNEPRMTRGRKRYGMAEERKNAAWDRKELIRRSLTIAPQSRDDFFGGRLLVIAG